MKPLTILSALALSVTLSGCSGLSAFLTTPGSKGGTIGSAILQDIQGCDRHYEGALGAGVTGSFDITCKAQPQVVSLRDIDKLPPN